MQMRTFEIHITGSPNINEVLDNLHIKNIIVDLQKPNGDILRTEHMSSFVEKHADIHDCRDRVDVLVNELKRYGVKIIRVKIETPYYEDYVPYSEYMESHFVATSDKFAKSVNRRSGKVIGTDRTYHKRNYDTFSKLWVKEDLELCIFDTNPEQDDDWLDLYGRKW